MNRLLPLVLALLWAPAASAADRLELSRAQAAQARTALAEVKARQARLQGELDALGQRIQGLKAHASGALLRGGELDASLKRSQELSTTLTGLATQVERANADAERANASLATALSDELSRLRAEWDRGGQEERARLLSRMRALRAERESLRSALPNAQVPAVAPGQGNEDPEELLEQADALRDAEDKVKKRLAALEARITETREERELDRRMGEFSREGALFDEQDRRLRRERGSDGDLSAASASPEADTSSFPGGGNTGPKELHPSGSSTFAAGGGTAPNRPPQVGPGTRAPAEDIGDLPSMEAQREALKKLAAELEQKATQAESKARALSGH